MITYRFTIQNEDDCQKIVYASGNTYMDAVHNMKREHGNGWVVVSSKIVFAN